MDTLTDEYAAWNNPDITFSILSDLLLAHLSVKNGVCRIRPAVTQFQSICLMLATL